MKQLTPLVAAISTIVLTACTKEVDLDLKNESSKVVIEAIITEGTGPQTVRITRSVDFAVANDFPGVQNAVVTLSDDQGHSEQLSETAPGTYGTSALEGVAGRTYALTATVDGTTYTARVSMPEAVPLDMLLIDSIATFGSYTKVIIPVYVDPATSANYYRFIVYVNGEKLDDVNVVDDRLTNGNTVFQPVFLNDRELKSGDQVQVTMECIAPEVYDYFFSLMQNTMNAATPADPTSNIRGGALGYFSVRTSSSRSVMVP